jgi:hypothetical protein
MALSTVLAVLAIVLDFAIAVVLVRKYLRTRDVGFIWLGLAVVIWPLVPRLLVVPFIDSVVRQQPVGFYPFNLVERGQLTLGEVTFYINSIEQIVGVCLLLVAVLYLSKTRPTDQTTS